MPVYLVCPKHPTLGEIAHGYMDAGPHLLHVYHSIAGTSCERWTADGFDRWFPTKLEAFDTVVAPRFAYDRLWIAGMRARIKGNHARADRIFVEWHKKNGTYIEEPQAEPEIAWPDWEAAVLIGVGAYGIDLSEMTEDFDLKTWWANGFTVEDSISDVLYDLGITRPGSAIDEPQAVLSDR